MIAPTAVLRTLSVRNLALVERVELELGPGLNALTGETGAGKSILVGALSLVLGGRAQADAIRTGAAEAVVEALLAFGPRHRLAEQLVARGVEAADGELVVRRVVSRQARSRVLLNGQLATVSMLQGVLRGGVDLTSQHEHVSLLDPAQHLLILDAFGELGPLRQGVERAYEEVLGYRTSLEALDGDQSDKARREDYIRFALEEIASIDPQPGELAKLEAERRRLRSAHELVAGLQSAEGALYADEGAVVERVGRVQKELVRLAGFDERLSALTTTASGVLAELEDLARELGRYGRGIHADPARLEAIDDRVAQLRRLTRKHGGTVEAVLEARTELARELDGLEHEEVRRADLLELLRAADERLQAAALELSAARQRVKVNLEKSVMAGLRALSMEKTRFEVALAPVDSPGPRGAETVEFLLAANPGEPPRPLRRTASGGELSRVLLAVKRALRDRSDVSTYVFDEIDSGIGGAVADVLGQQLADVARSSQVVVVTHLPQVAAHADHHFRVFKRVVGDRSVTQVEPLSGAERIEELARMLGGAAITDTTRALAEEMIAQAVGPRTRGPRMSSRRPRT